MKINAMLALAVIFTLASSTIVGAESSAQTINTWPTEERVVALTFDAGSDRGISDRILNILESHDARASFFLTGQWIEEYPEEARRIASAGHSLGNHGYSHAELTDVGEDRVREEISRTENIARDILGRGLRPFFRPPYGAQDEHLLRLAGDEGYDYSIMWTVDTLDWDGASAQTVLERVRDALRPGAIILMHVGSGTETAEALPLVLEYLSAEGYRPVTLEEMIEERSEGRVHRVQPGDTLYGIAFEYGVDAEEIAQANGLTDPFIIQIGDVLTIPGGEPEPPPDPEPVDEEPEDPEPPEDEVENGEEERSDPPEEEGESEEEEEYPWWSFPFRLLGMLWRGIWGLAADGMQLLIDFIRRG